MADMTSTGAEGLTPELEEAAYYHEASLNSAWVGSRLSLGALTFGFGAFIFAYFFLRSTNSFGMWSPAGFHDPQMWAGTLIMSLVVASAVIQAVALQRLKRGRKAEWIIGAEIALVFGLAAIAIQVWQLLNLPFFPGTSGFASVFVGTNPVFITVAFVVMVWLHMLVGRCRRIPQISFVEQPPTYTEAFALQRFQAALSGFTLVWGYLAIVAVVMWCLFYLVH
jgi:heme/copper-type cytochrome/quinol oxidase subunit 3